MPRTYDKKGKFKVYTEEDRDKAFSLFDEPGPNQGVVNRVSNVLGIPQTTLRDWLKARTDGRILKLGVGSATALPAWIERDIAGILVFHSDAGYPMRRPDLQDLVQSMIVQTRTVDLLNKFKDNRPGDDWARRFESEYCNVFTRRKKEGLTYKRAEGLTVENVDMFMDKLEYLQKTFHIKPQNMWNTDESGFSGSSAIDRAKVYVGKEVKNAYQLTTNNQKTIFTVLFCCSAKGEWLPPFTLYKAYNLYHSWTCGGVEDAGYSFVASGWMEEHIFEQWYLQMFLPKSTPEVPGDHCLLVFDGHNSHLSYKVAKAAKDNKVHLGGAVHQECNARLTIQKTQSVNRR